MDERVSKLAVEIMNITGGKYTDKQEEEMMQAVQAYCDKQSRGARIKELKRAKKYQLGGGESTSYFYDFTSYYIDRLAELESAPIKEGK